MVACLALSVLVCSSAHNAFWRFTVLVLGTSGVRRLLAPGRGGDLALGVYACIESFILSVTHSLTQLVTHSLTRSAIYVPFASAD